MSVKLSTYTQLKSKVLKCSNCDLYCHELEGHDPKVIGEGNLDAKVMFIAEAPGLNETIYHRPLTPPGVSGVKYEEVLAELGLKREEVYTTNTILCMRGKCSILTDIGWKQIDNVVKHKYNGKVASVDKDGRLVYKKIINWYRSEIGNRKLYKINLNNSRKSSNGLVGAILTEDHPVLTNRGYVKIKDLKKTDKIHSGTYSPSNEIQEMIVGIILGDGTIGKKNNSFSVTHTINHIEYSKHITNILGGVYYKIYHKDNKGYVCSRLNVSPFFRMLRKNWYNSKRKIITDELLKNFSIISLAYLFMDDGYMRFRYEINKAPLAEIATCSFTREENQKLIEAIKKLGINCYMRKPSKYSRIYFDVENTKKLSEKIAKYVIGCMNYKIFPEHRNIEKYIINIENQIFYDGFSLQEEDKIKGEKYVYCIDVEDTSNFLTRSGIVHNCRPPKNRDPEPWELLRCSGFFKRQIELVSPKLIVSFGRFAGQSLVRNFKMTADRGKIIHSDKFGIDIFPLYHPAYIKAYASLERRREFESDVVVLKEIIKKMGV